MKKIDMAKAIGLADEDFVAEAAPVATRTKSIFRRKFAIVAACVSLVVTSVFLWLILPFSNEVILPDLDINKDLPEELKAYADSEYIDLLSAIYKYNNVPTSYDFSNSEFGIFLPNNPRRSSIETNISSSDEEGFKPDSIDDHDWVVRYASASATAGNYVETTDNQVKGVIETDIFKRTKTHIFYLDKEKKNINVYSIAGEESKLVSRVLLTDELNLTSSNFINGEMFLSQDGKTLTVMCNVWKEKTSDSTGYSYIDVNALLISFDVSDPENIEAKSHFYITGFYKTARVVNGEILLFSQYDASHPSVTDFSEIDRIVPSINCGEGFTPIPADNIIIPDKVTSRSYTVITKLNESDLSFKDSIACLSYSNTVYVSTDKIFITGGYADCIEREKNGEKYVNRINMTEITAISYKGEGFEKLGSACVEGSVKNQYSLDEFNGILRVVTTTSGTNLFADKYLVTEEGLYCGDPDGGNVRFESIATNASLYCIDLSNFEIVGEVRDFAPAGETVESVRFDGTNAYVCTAVARTLIDPVYFFDLSDLNNITYTDTGYFDGYSSSLVNFGEGLLLGIGYGESRSTLKIEVYAEDGDKVISLDSYEVKDCWFSTEYKSYFIDRERGLVGLPYHCYESKEGATGYRYLLLGFDGYQLFEVIDEGFGKTHPTSTRATLADDYFYMMSMSEFKVVKLFD